MDTTGDIATRIERPGYMRRATSLAGEPDPWNIEEDEVTQDEANLWKNLTTGQKVKRVTLNVLKVLAILFLLYTFVCSLSLLSNGFRLVGGRSAGQIFQQNELLRNPVAGLMIGVLATVLLQSSSTTTSIVVSMVSAQILQVQHAVYIIMGANIGTSVTNTLVSLFHSADRNEYRRAFAAATVHDMFNWLTVGIFLPVEVVTYAIFGKGYLFFLSEQLVGSAPANSTGESQDFLKYITKPLTNLLVKLDKKTINDIAHNIETNGTINLNVCNDKYCPLLRSLGDHTAGAIVLIISLICLCLSLICIVKVLHSLLHGTLLVLIRKMVNAEFPGCWKHLTGYLAMVVGAVVTFLVQSSSIFTSTLTPLVAIGVLTLERAYPLTLGANLGTTGTALIAAFSVEQSLRESFQIALCHLFFNLSGILAWYPVPLCRKVPIKLARFLGNTTANYRWFALFYLIFMFAIVPLIVFSLSLAGWQVLLAVGVVVFVFIFAILLINFMQKRAPDRLPEKLRSWEFLPEFMRSLEPYDRFIGKIRLLCCCNKAQNIVPSDLNEPERQISVYSVTKGWQNRDDESQSRM